MRENVVFENGKYWLDRPGDLFDGVRLTDCCQAMDKGTEYGIVCRCCWRSIEGTGECYEYRTPEHEARHRKTCEENAKRYAA